MKKTLYGLGCVSVGGILAMIVWSLRSALFVMEGSPRSYIMNMVTLFVWVPIPVYLIHTLCLRLAYRSRLDTDEYQPLCRPVVPLITLALQCIPMCVLWSTFRNAAQASAGFYVALVIVCLSGLISITAALVVGRPLPGTTRFPGVRADR